MGFVQKLDMEYIALAPQASNLSGVRFAQFVVLGPSSRAKNGDVMWDCLCDCGTSFQDRKANIARRLSCGCAAREAVARRSTKHGKARAGITDRTYTTWIAMRRRCLNPKAIKYLIYGGRGIKICPEWREFSKFIRDMGERPPGRTLDRIDANGDYTPGNCRWAPPLEQRHNRRKT